MENLDKLCMSYLEPIYTVKMNFGLVESISKLNLTAQNMDLPSPQVIASTEFENEQTRIMFTGHKDWIHLLVAKLENQNNEIVGDIQYGVFISGFGLTSSNYEQNLFESLHHSKLKVLKYIRDAHGLLLVCNEIQKVKLINHLNSLNQA